MYRVLYSFIFVSLIGDCDQESASFLIVKHLNDIAEPGLKTVRRQNENSQSSTSAPRFSFPPEIVRRSASLAQLPLCNSATGFFTPQARATSGRYQLKVTTWPL